MFVKVAIAGYIQALIRNGDHSVGKSIESTHYVFHMTNNRAIPQKLSIGKLHQRWSVLHTLVTYFGHKNAPALGRGEVSKRDLRGFMQGFAVDSLF